MAEAVEAEMEAKEVVAEGLEVVTGILCLEAQPPSGHA